ncbi:MAG: DUF3817 domain-containing protein [Pseudonocardiaceae bacterium]|nr:DUF3817 domain-containing protein [Pseudonocardiaceae bacterium]
MSGALIRYRVLAYVVGVGLLALVAAMIVKYAGDNDTPMSYIGPGHGFLYVLYLIFAVDLGIKARWSIKATILVLLAGMVPFVSFIAERKVTRKVAAGIPL